MIGKAHLTTTARKTNHTTRYPAPDGGVDTRAAVGKSELSTCVYTYNLVPFEYGMVVRKGYREEDIIIVLSGPSYLVGGYDPHDKVWAFRYESLHPITARAGTPAYGPCLASGPDLGEVINQLIRH